MIQHLPNEILTKIFDSLSPASLHEARKVCNRWSLMAKNHGVCQIDLSHFEPNAGKIKLIDKIKNYIPTEKDGQQVRHLLIICHFPLYKSVFSFLQRLCPYLLTFNYDMDVLDYGINSTMKMHLFLSYNWQHYITHLPAQIIDDDDDAPWIDNDNLCRRLESLHVDKDSSLISLIKNGYYRVCVPYLPRLDTLAIHSSVKFRENAINHIHRQCPRLTTLTLQDVTLGCVFGRRKYSKSVTTEPRMQQLTLESVTFLHHMAFDHLYTKYPNINTLTLYLDKKNYPNAPKKRFGRRGLMGCVFDLVTGFKHLTKLAVHFNGFGKKHAGFVNTIQNFVDHRENKIVVFKVSYT